LIHLIEQDFFVMASAARWLVIVGLIFILTGGLVYLVSKTGIPLGRLPGDIRIVRDNITCIIPLATSIILSVVLTIILNLIFRSFGGK
jgi:hypothetical protein